MKLPYMPGSKHRTKYDVRSTDSIRANKIHTDFCPLKLQAAMRQHVAMFGHFPGKDTG